jgi:hypothetical protein
MTKLFSLLLIASLCFLSLADDADARGRRRKAKVVVRGRSAVAVNVVTPAAVVRVRR